MIISDYMDSNCFLYTGLTAEPQVLTYMPSACTQVLYGKFKSGDQNSTRLFTITNKFFQSYQKISIKHPQLVHSICRGLDSFLESYVKGTLVQVIFVFI